MPLCLLAEDVRRLTGKNNDNQGTSSAFISLDTAAAVLCPCDSKSSHPRASAAAVEPRAAGIGATQQPL